MTPQDGELRRINNDLEHISHEIDRLLEKHRPPITPEDRVWAAVALSLNPETCRSIHQGRVVLARNLDARILTNSLRGKPRPDPTEWIHVTDMMLDAIVEAGPPAL